MSSRSAIKRFREAAIGVMAGLMKREEIINVLNVFPVPDGDTGTNMYLTALIAFEEMEKTSNPTVGNAAGNWAKGALTGSRGNSGVILSQFLEGVAHGLARSPVPDTEDLTLGFEKGTEYAYRSVIEPREGTMLTVMREMTAGLKKTGVQDLEGFLITAHRLACESLRRTPELLDALSRAGVVDAGGAGVVAALEGALEAIDISTEPFEWSAYTERPPVPRYDGPRWGMRFMVECQEEDLEKFKREITSLGESVIFAGEQPPYRVHVHTDYPELVLEAARAVGPVSGLDAVGLGGQVADFHRGSPAPPTRVSVVSCARGDGLLALFEQLGSTVVEGGSGAQPSTGILLDAIKNLDSEMTILLPNDPNTIPAATAAANASDNRVEVIPTGSPVQGLAAMEEYLEDEDPESVLGSMTYAAGRFGHGSVVRAVRNAKVGELDVAGGQYLGLTDGGGAAAGDEIAEVVASVCVELARGDKSPLVMLIEGEDLSEQDKVSITEALSRRFPDSRQEWYLGSQPHQLVLIGIAGAGGGRGGR